MGTTPDIWNNLPVSTTEVVEMIKRMKPGKTARPDDMAADLWKVKGWKFFPILHICDIVQITVCRTGFVKSCGAAEAIYTLPLFMQKYDPFYIRF